MKIEETLTKEQREQLVNEMLNAKEVKDPCNRNLIIED